MFPYWAVHSISAKDKWNMTWNMTWLCTSLCHSVRADIIMQYELHFSYTMPWSVIWGWVSIILFFDKDCNVFLAKVWNSQILQVENKCLVRLVSDLTIHFSHFSLFHLFSTLWQLLVFRPHLHLRRWPIHCHDIITLVTWKYVTSHYWTKPHQFKPLRNVKVFPGVSVRSLLSPSAILRPHQ